MRQAMPTKIAQYGIARCAGGILRPITSTGGLTRRPERSRLFYTLMPSDGSAKGFTRNQPDSSSSTAA